MHLLFRFPETDQNANGVKPDICIKSDSQDFHCRLTLQQELHLRSGKHSTIAVYDSGLSNSMISQIVVDDSSLEYQGV